MEMSAPMDFYMMSPWQHRCITLQMSKALLKGRHKFSGASLKRCGATGWCNKVGAGDPVPLMGDMTSKRSKNVLAQAIPSSCR